MKRVALLLVLLALCSAKLLRTPTDHKDWKEDVDYKWFEQRLDHFDMQNSDTFNQRYWINDQYYNAKNGGGPLFLSICGEWTCSNVKNDSYVASLAKEHGAMLVVHEHRYYGMSQPKESWSTDNLRWLNTDQALADIATFADAMSTEIAAKYDVPKKRWLLFGGSYPGALVSWFRNKYPHIAFGSWSSSGVINAIQDFHQFDETVSYALGKSGKECPSTVRSLIEFTDREFEEGRGAAIKKVFNGEEMRDDEFHWFYSDVIAETVQYGQRTELCQRVADLGTDFAAMNQMIMDWQVGKKMGRDDYWSVTLQNTTIDFGKNGRQWTYQYCSELGYLQTPAVTYAPLKNKGLDLDFWHSYCSRIYGRDTFPDTHLWNLRYGGSNPAVSKVIYMNGDEDPWKPTSILETKNALIHAFPNICDDCAHCVDLREPVDTKKPEIKKNRGKAEKIISRWINFEKKVEKKDVDVSERESMSLKALIK
jgi:pimeloyl-ACP methyl ester carboxylesterase